MFYFYCYYCDKVVIKKSYNMGYFTFGPIQGNHKHNNIFYQLTQIGEEGYEEYKRKKEIN